MTKESVTKTSALMWLMNYSQHGELAPGMRESDRAYAIAFVKAGLSSDETASKALGDIAISITNVKGSYHGE